MEKSTTSLITALVRRIDPYCQSTLNQQVANTLLYPHPSFTGEYAREAILEAMDAYMEQTCITFEERTTQEDYVRFFSGDGLVGHFAALEI